MPNKTARAQDRRRRGGGFARETNLRRDRNTREERRSVLIVTNGEKTEINYFKALRDEPWVTADKVTPKFERGAPMALVKRAAEIRVDSAYDEAWVVCDVDEYDVAPAIKAAARHEFLWLTLSRPCFEVWLVLHLKSGCPGFNDAAQVGTHLKRLLPHWDKTDLRFADFRAGIHDATDRAKALGALPGENPATAIWQVIESLRDNRRPSDVA